VDKDILFSRENHLGLVTLNRQKALNALTLPMITAMHQQLKLWANDSQIHAIVVMAAPGKAFCAGGDVRWLYEMGHSNNPNQMQFFEQEYQLNQYIHDYPKPYVALMDGITMGGGVGISLHGSHPVATEHFIFAMPETSIGFFPDIGASHVLSRAPGFFGIYLGLTGRQVAAHDAKALGLVRHLVSSCDGTSLLKALSEADLSHHADAGVSDCIQRFTIPTESSILNELQSLVDGCFQALDMVSLINGLQKQDSEWHRALLTTLNQKSPLSLNVTLAQIQKAKSMSLAECLAMDLCLVAHFVKGHDFYEGVRALLIDKDKAPHWQPKTMAAVTPAMVATYFE